MDLNNLSLDELLMQIRGDGGHQQQVQAEQKQPEPVPEEAAAVIYEPEMPAQEPQTETVPANDEPLFIPLDEPDEKTEQPEEAADVTYEPKIPVQEPHTETVPAKDEPLFVRNDREEASPEPTSAFDSLSLDELLKQVSSLAASAFGSAEGIPPESAATAEKAEENSTDDDYAFSLSALLDGYKANEESGAQAENETDAEQTETQAEGVNPFNFEVADDDYGEDDDDILASVFYSPKLPEDYSFEPPKQPQTETVPEPSTESSSEPSPEPSPEKIPEQSSEPSSKTIEKAEDDEEIKHYEPPKPEAIQPEQKAPESGRFAVFGNINIDADIETLFPEIVEDAEHEIVIENPEYMTDNNATAEVEQELHEESQTEETPAQKAEAKTIIIGELNHNGAVFERPGIVTGRKMFGNTADLRAIPAILPADELLKDKYQSGEKTFVRTGSIPIIVQQKARAERPDDAQMLLPGFGEVVETEHVDEEEVEDELRKTRSRKVGSFKLEGVENDEPQLDDEIIDEFNESGGDGRRQGKRFSLTKTRVRLNKQGTEYTRPSDRKKVTAFLKRKKALPVFSAVVSGACSIALLITTAIPAVADRIDASFAPSFLGGRPSSYLIALAILAVTAAVGIPVCSSGVSCFFNGSGKPNSQTPVFIALVVSLVQIVVAIIFYDGEKVAVFALAAAFAVFLCSVGRWLVFSRISDNFEFLVSRGKEGLYTVRTVDDTADANSIGRNVVMGDAEVRYSGKTRFATNFIAYSLASDSADDLCVKLVPISIIVSLLIATIAGFVTKNIMCAVSTFSGALCMGTPASAAIVANLPLSSTNKKLRKDGAIITGYASAFEYETTNAIAVDAADLFPGTYCDIHGMRTFMGVRIDDAILTAASMLVSAGGPISSLFNDVVMGRKELLMNVEELTYEDKLGLSGWIRGRRVFLGNRKMLENHNIDIPMQIDEARYRHDGRRVLYLADAGKIAAIFVVSYGTDVRIAEHLRKIESNGINILIRTTDSNITEEFVANCFDLPLNSVKVVSTAAGEVLKSYADRVTPRADAQLLHNGSAAAFLHSVSAASSLCSTAGLISAQQTFCTAAGLLLMAVIVLFSSAFNVSALQVLICHAVWLGIGIVLPMIERD